jgi:hypothetical protein
MAERVGICVISVATFVNTVMEGLYKRLAARCGGKVISSKSSNPVDGRDGN